MTSLPTAGSSPARSHQLRSSSPPPGSTDGLSGRRARRTSCRAQLLVIAGASSSLHLLHYRVETPRGFRNGYRPVHELDQLADELPDIGAHRTVYLACAPRARRSGGRDAVERVECLWADCDTDDALAALDRFTPPPSLLIASGGLTATGRRKLHAYWRLAMRVNTEEADAALKRLQCHLASDPRCAEPARVLRPAGATWRKDGEVRPVELVSVDLSAVYPIADVLYCTQPPPEPAAAPTPVRRVHLGNHNGGDLDALEAALKTIPPPIYVEALTGHEPNRAGKIACPFHPDWNPSFHVYETAERGWTCFQCDDGQGRLVGGTIIDLGARLYGMDPRREYPALLRRLAEELLR